MSDTMPERIWVAPTVGNVGHQGQGRTWYSMTPVGGTIEYVRADTRTVAPADDERDAMIETIAELERDRDALREVARMSLHQLEFQYGKRKRGWDAAFLMERLNRAISDSEGSDTTPPAVPLDARIEMDAQRMVDRSICAEPSGYCEESVAIHYNDLISLITSAIQRATPPAASGPQTCVKCGHSAGVNSVGECRQCIDWLKHVCEFPAATTSAIEAAKAAAATIMQRVLNNQFVSVDSVAEIITKHLNDSARPTQPSAPEPSSDARKVAREIVESYFMYSDRLLDKNALIDRITTALTSTRSQLLKQIREAVEAEQVEDDGSGVWDAGHYDGINDALAAIDKVAKTSQTEPTNQSETRAVDGEWQPPIDLTKHFAKHPHVSLVDGVLGGVTPIVSKIRISVTHILGYLYHGKSIPEIGKTYSLSEEAVRDAIAFAHDVYDEVIHGPDDDD